MEAKYFCSLTRARYGKAEVGASSSSRPRLPPRAGRPFRSIEHVEGILLDRVSASSTSPYAFCGASWTGAVLQRVSSPWRRRPPFPPLARSTPSGETSWVAAKPQAPSGDDPDSDSERLGVGGILDAGLARRDELIELTGDPHIGVAGAERPGLFQGDVGQRFPVRRRYPLNGAAQPGAMASPGQRR